MHILPYPMCFLYLSFRKHLRTRDDKQVMVSKKTSFGYGMALLCLTILEEIHIL